MKRRTSITTAGFAVVVLALSTTACGSSSDTNSGDAAPPSTAASTTSTSKASETPKSAGGEDLTIFCTNAPTYGFERLDYVLPHTPEHGRELKAKLDLVTASAPAEIDAQLATFNETTYPYLDAMASGEIGEDPQTVIAWSKAYSAEQLQATSAAQKEIADYIAANC